MKLLYIGGKDDGPYLDKFSKLPVLVGHHTAVSRNPTIRTSADVALLAKSLSADAVICANQEILKLILETQFDYIAPSSRKGVTLNDYAGSILTLHAIPNFTTAKEVLVLNPPEHLQTVPYASFVFQRFISKLTKPEDWYPQTTFEWKCYDPMVENIDAFVHHCSTADLLAVDIETAVGDPDRRINCVGYCAYTRATNTTICGVIPFTSWAAVCAVRAINNSDAPKITQGGLYDNAYFARWGVPCRNWFYDTLHLFHSWLSELPKRLDFVAAMSVRRIRFWKDDGSTGNLHDYYRYNALDCWATLNSFLGLLKDIPQWGIKNYLQEFPLVFPCHHCSLEGFKIDLPLMESAAARYQAELESDLKQFRYMIDSPNFNPGSWQQVQQLFKVLGLVLPSTDATAMLKAKASSPFNERILNFVTSHRENQKLLSIQLNVEKVWNGRIYYAINPAGTVTGRLASEESHFWCGVQIQNITRGVTVKQCYVADPGWVLCEIDKKQSEARCVGYLSGEEKLITLVESDRDYHKSNAESFFGVPYDLITKILRDLAKRVNHGANYNMTGPVMLDTMGPKHVLFAKKALRLPFSMRLIDVCNFLLQRYDETYPKIKGQYYESIIKRIVLSGILVSALGWTRRFFGKPDKNKRDLNIAVAHEPQNLSVGIVNKEFYRIWFASIYGELKGRVRLKAQIHDSILFQYRLHDNGLPTLIRDRYMDTTVRVTDPKGVVRSMFIPSDIAAGKQRWSELKD